jgi:hypothetical protein
MIKKAMLILPLVSLFFMGCEDKEKKRLEAQNDSLRTELQVSQQTASHLEEIGSLMDSIDASRQVLRTDVVEGTSYKDYKNRLVSINNYIRETRLKIEDLERKSKNNQASMAQIRRLKNELELSTQQIAALQEQVDKTRGENQTLSRNINQRDSLLNLNTETIKLRDQDIANLENRVKEINDASQQSQADLYYAQAEALETAASRTRFAPRKKKETQREALELYKRSLSLGKEEAQARIEELERDLG